MPAVRHAIVPEAHLAVNYTTVLNVVFLAIGAALLIRFLKTGGAEMLAMMNQPMGSPE